MKKEKRSYFASKWNYLEIMVIILSVVAIVFYLMKTAYTYWLLDLILESKGKKHVRMHSLAVFDKTLTQILAFVLFIATLKLLRLLRFNKRIGYLSATLKLAGGEILAFFSVMLLTMISFVSFFYFSSKTTSRDYSTFIRAIEASFFIIGDKFADIHEGSRMFGPITYFAFAFMMYFVVFPFLIAIICSAFSAVKADLGKQPNDFEVVDYMITVAGTLVKRFMPGIRAKDKHAQHDNNKLDYACKKLDIVLTDLNRNSRAYQSPIW